MFSIIIVVIIIIILYIYIYDKDWDASSVGVFLLRKGIAARWCFFASESVGLNELVTSESSCCLDWATLVN